jgi:cobalamin biosynthesis protein CobT
MDALATMPYELVAKESNKKNENKEYGPPAPYRASSKNHYPLWREEPDPLEDHGEEAEDENDEYYDKVSVDGWEMYSARTSKETKDDSEERDTKDAVTKDGYDDEYEEYDEEEEEEEEKEEEGEEDDDRTSCEDWDRPKKSDASEMYQFPKPHDVIIEMEGTGMSLRITVGPYDTWNNLTEKLQRVISLPPNGVIFFYWGTTYEQGDNRMLEKVKVWRYA